MDGYLTLKEASKKIGISDRRLNTLCLAGRIEGATRVGNIWIVPVDVKIPDDRRIKSGKYIKRKKDENLR